MTLLIVLTDERGPRNLTSYWCGSTNGWSNERSDAEEYASREDADVELSLAWSTLRGAGEHTFVEIQEMTSDEPWNRPTCTLRGLGRQIVMAGMLASERMCTGCHGDRTVCGGDPV